MGTSDSSRLETYFTGSDGRGGTSFCLLVLEWFRWWYMYGLYFFVWFPVGNVGGAQSLLFLLAWSISLDWFAVSFFCLSFIWIYRFCFRLGNFVIGLFNFCSFMSCLFMPLVGFFLLRIWALLRLFLDLFFGFFVLFLILGRLVEWLFCSL